MAKANVMMTYNVLRKGNNSEFRSIVKYRRMSKAEKKAARIANKKRVRWEDRP